MKILRIILGSLFLFCVGNAYPIAERSCGQETYMTYCSGCHTLRYAGLPNVSLLPKEANRWFGKIPPDLTEVVNVRGASWISDYLNGFYQDTSKPFGRNNRMLPDTAMPDILGSLDVAERQYVINDIVCYLKAVALPNHALRIKIGLFVLSFFGVFTLCWVLLIIAYKKKA